MKRPKRDPVREDRIDNEAIVDAGPEEQAMSWYYYLKSKISFPFQARCIAAKAVSPLRKGETVEVIRMAPEDACEHDMLVRIRWQGRKLVVPLSQLMTKPLVTGITGFRRAAFSELCLRLTIVGQHTKLMQWQSDTPNRSPHGRMSRHSSSASTGRDY
jgi:hypothetical protein